MMVVKDMSTDLRADLNSGHVEMDEEIYVEVDKVDKTLLRELPGPE